MSKIIIFDTTLRDGMQGTGINFTLNDKIQIYEIDQSRACKIIFMGG